MKQKVLDKLHATLLEIMDEIDRVCRENNITYFLAGGSLLGAVRHKGFIPWDDDMDIMMFREDYERFCTLYPTLNSDKYYLLSRETNPRYWKSHAKLCKKNTVFKEHVGEAEGIFVDVFPIDLACEHNNIHQKIRFALSIGLDRVITKRIYSNYNPGKAKWLYWGTRFLSLNNIRDMKNSIMTEKKRDYNRYVMFESVGIYRAERSLWNIEKFGMPIETEFEGRKYFIPSGYDDILTTTFHDYMQLPPPDKRRIHHPERISFDTNGPDEILD